MKTLILLLTIAFCTPLNARTNVIFSMIQELSMGLDDEVIRKNYYVNIGENQGVKKDSILDVFRVVSIQNPYDNKKRVNYKVKIGELKVIHSTEDAAIAAIKELKIEGSPVFDIPQFMIGDHVAISVE